MKPGPKKGQRLGVRQKGTPNKTTASVKEVLIEAFDRSGGVDSLVRWAQKEPAEFYRLWAKLLPSQVDFNDVTGLEAKMREAEARLKQTSS